MFKYIKQNYLLTRIIKINEKFHHQTKLSYYFLNKSNRDYWKTEMIFKTKQDYNDWINLR